MYFFSANIFGKTRLSDTAFDSLHHAVRIERSVYERNAVPYKNIYSLLLKLDQDRELHWEQNWVMVYWILYL